MSENDRPARTPEVAGGDVRSPETPADHAHEAECSDAVSLLWEYLDGELDSVTMVRVREHLERCSPCLEAFDFHAELRQVVQDKCGESMPPEMRSRLLGLLCADENGTAS